MGLQPVKTAAQKFRTVIIKAFEYFTGGFTFTLTGFTDTVLPEGSLVKVSESARTTTAIKTGVLVEKSPATTRHHLKSDGDYPLLFAVGDALFVNGGATAAKIKTIKETTGSGWVVTTSAAINTGTAGTVVYAAVASGIGAPTIAPVAVANAIVAHDSTIGESYTALRRGTVYKNRMQPHVAANIADLPATIQLSESK